MKRILALAAGVALALGGLVAPQAAAAGGAVPIAAAPPGAKLVGYSDPEDGKVVPLYEFTPPTLTKQQRAADLKRMSKGVKGLKLPPPTPGRASRAALMSAPWYAWAGGWQTVNADGAFANCNVPASSDPFLRPDNSPPGVQGDSHSLCEIAIMNPGSGGTRDIAEIGWIKNRDASICPVGSRCLFGFYWVDGAPAPGGYNSGFVDNAANSVDLGDVLPSTCAGGNTRLGQQFYLGDVWLWADLCTTDATAGDWVGYFPGSLWTPTGAFTQATAVDFFGEVASGVDSNMCSDMGNGILPTATNGAARIGSAQLINPSSPISLGMHANTEGHGSQPTAFNAVASNTPTSTFRFGGGGWTAGNLLPGNTGSC